VTAVALDQAGFFSMAAIFFFHFIFYLSTVYK